MKLFLKPLTLNFKLGVFLGYGVVKPPDTVSTLFEEEH